MTDTWPPPEVDHLLTQLPGRYERCPANEDFAREQVERVVDSECQQVMFAAHRGDWAKANTDAYDGARKCIEMLLLAHGWRVRTEPGAHVATVNVVSAWLKRQEPPAPRLAKAFSASRKARNAAEYPDARERPESITALRGYAMDNVRLINLVRVRLGLAPRDDLVPSTDNVAAWRKML